MHSVNVQEYLLFISKLRYIVLIVLHEVHDGVIVRALSLSSWPMRNNSFSSSEIELQLGTRTVFRTFWYTGTNEFLHTDIYKDVAMIEY